MHAWRLLRLGVMLSQDVEGASYYCCSLDVLHADVVCVVYVISVKKT